MKEQGSDKKENPVSEIEEQERLDGGEGGALQELEEEIQKLGEKSRWDRLNFLPKLIVRVYRLVWAENPALALIGTAALIAILPIPWMGMYQNGVEWMQQLRGWLGV